MLVKQATYFGKCFGLCAGENSAQWLSSTGATKSGGGGGTEDWVSCPENSLLIVKNYSVYINELLSTAYFVLYTKCKANTVQSLLSPFFWKFLPGRKKKIPNPNDRWCAWETG
jgi:hypothetical protein